MTTSKFAVGVTTVTWFFSGQGSDEDMNATDVSVLKGVWWAFRYHLGSLCFGSFLITITSLIRLLFEYFCSYF